jgi:uncharacterized protein YecE (DUF72 family)
VGVDRGFYAPVPEPDLARYAAAVPRDFRFVLKAHAALTVPPDARPPPFLGRASSVFLDAAYAADRVIGPARAAWGDRLGIVLFQFSPLGSSPSMARLLQSDTTPFCERLARFLAELPRGVCYAIEWRDPQLLTATYARVLQETGAIHGACAHPRMPDVAEQFARAPGAPGSSRLIRWLLHPGQSYEGARARYAPFDRLVDPDERVREQVAAQSVAALAAGRDVTVIANNKAEGSAPLTLRQLAVATDRAAERSG